MIGIFGGTFDPIHFGHLRSASEVKLKLDLEALYLVPAASPPHRPSPVATSDQRMAMLELALIEFPELEADDRELRRGGTSYTVDTLQAYRAEYPLASLALLMGVDAFGGIESWHQWQRLPELAHIIVMQRPGWEPEKLNDWAAVRTASSVTELASSPAGKFLFYPVAPQAISATEIRRALVERRSVSDLLPSSVLDYIQQNHIYTDN